MTDPETGKQVWTPYMLRQPPLPGYPGPERFGECEGVFKDGRQIGPAPLYGWVREVDRLAYQKARGETYDDWLNMDD